jgi:hypothetical protein
MIIERPVYFIEIVGDVKEYASQLPSTIITTYESLIDTTYIVVAGDENNYANQVEKQYREIHSSLKNKKNKGDLTIKYLKDGINFKNI